MSRASFAPLARWVWGLGMAAAAAVAAEPEEAPHQMAPITIYADRFPLLATSAGSSLEIMGGETLAARQIRSLEDLLGAWGAPGLSSGATGAASSVFLRGANSDHTLILVDGVRMNDANTPGQNLMATLPLVGVEQVELIRGPQSMLYGGEAMGGVLAVHSKRGSGAFSGSLGAGGGSHGTVEWELDISGESAGWSYALAGGAGRTENERPNNAFSRRHYAARLDRSLGVSGSVGLTLRGVDAQYQSPNSRFVDDPDNSENEENHLATLYWEHAAAETWRTRLVVGGQHRRLVSSDPGQGTESIGANQRVVVDWQSSLHLSERHLLLGGATLERSHGRNTGFGSIDHRQNLAGLFFQHAWSPIERLRLTGGLRYDEYDTFGSDLNYRLTAAGALPAGFSLRAAWGTGFRAPGFLDLYASSPFYVGNPALEPEKTEGGDFGLAWASAAGAVEIGVTLFENRFSNLISADFSQMPGRPVNIERASTRGVEWRLAAQLSRSIRAEVLGTYLEAVNTTQAVRLLRRPRHAGSVLVEWTPSGRISGGISAHWLADREDVHAATFSRIDAEDAVVARLYAAVQLSTDFTARLRLENVLNTRYEEVHGYPSPGLGLFGGVDYRF